MNTVEVKMQRPGGVVSMRRTWGPYGPLVLIFCSEWGFTQACDDDEIAQGWWRKALRDTQGARHVAATVGGRP